MRPALKPFYRIYRRDQSPEIYIGLGPQKFVIDEPTDEMIDFLLNLNGTHTLNELRGQYIDADDWVSALDTEGLIEDRDSPVRRPAITRRWSRQINYLRLYDRPGWNGSDAQLRLADAKVVVLGTGAGGSTLLRFLSAAGIGHLETVDFDTFALDNLPTHTTLDEQDVGMPKLDVLRRHLALQNSGLDFVTHSRRISSADDIAEIVDGADFFMQAYDRPRELATHWSNTAGLATGVPYSSIGVTDFGARVGAIVVPYESACWECVGISDVEFLQTEESAALTGSTVAMLAGIQVNEIIKVLTGATDSKLVGQTLYINTANLSFDFIPHERRADCSACGSTVSS